MTRNPLHNLRPSKTVSGEALVFWPSSDPLLTTAVPNVLERIRTVLTHRADKNRSWLEANARSVGFFSDWSVGPVTVNVDGLTPSTITLKLHVEAHYTVRTAGDDPPFLLVEHRQVPCTKCSQKERQRRLSEACANRARELQTGTRAFLYSGQVEGGPFFVGKRNDHDYFAQACRLTRRPTDKCIDSHGDVEDPECSYVPQPRLETFNRVIRCELRERTWSCPPDIAARNPDRLRTGVLNEEIANVLNEETRYGQDALQGPESSALNVDDGGGALVSLQKCGLVTPLFRQYCRLSASSVVASMDVPASATLAGERFDLAPYYSQPEKHGLYGLDPELRFALDWPRDTECLRQGALGSLVVKGSEGDTRIYSHQTTAAIPTTFVAHAASHGGFHLLAELAIQDPDEVEHLADRLSPRCVARLYDRHLAFNLRGVRSNLAALARPGHLVKSLVAATFMAYGQQQLAPRGALCMIAHLNQNLVPEVPTDNPAAEEWERPVGAAILSAATTNLLEDTQAAHRVTDVASGWHYFLNHREEFTHRFC